MGLSMYLKGHRYLSKYDKEPIEVTLQPNPLKKGYRELGYKVNMIECELIYWREANAIHQWFVDNVQDGEDECKEHYMPKDKLNELYQAVCSALDRPDEAEYILPTQSGFFFGSTEYNTFYFQNLQYTKTQIEKLLASGVLDTFSMYYHSSW